MIDVCPQRRNPHQELVELLPLSEKHPRATNSEKDDHRSGEDVPNDSVQQQMDRILQSRFFVRSDRLSRFLRFIVRHLLEGKQDELKEYTIGCEVYERRPPYDPSQDSIVRAEARRLRSKLKEYYETAGRDDTIYIFLRLGSYVPVVQFRALWLENLRVDSSGEPLLFASPPQMSVGILPFIDISAQPASARLAQVLPDAISFALGRLSACSVVSPRLTARFDMSADHLPELMSGLRLQAVFEGTVLASGSTLRVTARLLNAEGRQLWVRRLDMDAGHGEGFAVEDAVAAELSAALEEVSKRQLLHCRANGTRSTSSQTDR